MSSVNVMVVFYSRYGETEKLALAAGVGAIQARANIRLRRLGDLTASEVIEADGAWSENLRRMQKDYIAPREIDAQWADLVILAAPASSPAEMTQYLGSAGGLLKGKLAAVLGDFAGAAKQAGLNVVAPDDATSTSEAALRHGRRAAELALMHKTSRA
jgi:NAD(P)H dehydrogenase (quinone)